MKSTLFRYSMRAPSQRDRLAKELADKNSKAYRDKKSKAIKQAQKSLAGARLATGFTLCLKKLISCRCWDMHLLAP